MLLRSPLQLITPQCPVLLEGPSGNNGHGLQLRVLLLSLLSQVKTTKHLLLHLDTFAYIIIFQQREGNISKGGYSGMLRDYPLNVEGNVPLWGEWLVSPHCLSR